MYRKDIKNITFVTITCVLSSSKCTKTCFWLGLCPRAQWELITLPRPPSWLGRGKLPPIPFSISIRFQTKFLATPMSLTNNMQWNQGKHQYNWQVSQQNLRQSTHCFEHLNLALVHLIECIGQVHESLVNVLLVFLST